MKDDQILVKKNSNEFEPFFIQKFEKSLQSCGTTEEELQNIIHTIQPHIYDGISSNEIQKNFWLIKKI